MCLFTIQGGRQVRARRRKMGGNSRGFWREVTRWVTTGCGLKHVLNVSVQRGHIGHPAGHRRVWIETS